MTIVDLVRAEAKNEGLGLLITASLAGASNALILSLVDDAASASADERLRLFALMGLSVALYVVCARRTFHRTTQIIENALQKLKVRLIHEIEQAELSEIEGIGTSLIYDRLTENISVVSDSAGHIANVLQSVCIVVSASLYILSISMPGFALLVLLSGSGIIMWSMQRVEIRKLLDRSAEARVTFIEQLTDLLKGFKEVRLGRQRGVEVRRDITATIDAYRQATVAASNLFNDNYILGQCVLFALLAAVTFVLPQNVAIDSAKLMTLVGAVLFLWGPLGGVVSGVPQYMRSNRALDHIHALEEKIQQACHDRINPEDAIDPWNGKFAAIEVENVRFGYPNDGAGQTFRIGPMTLRIAAGEVLFIVGGNGSGKSTFMKVLCGLYRVSSGRICVDRSIVRGDNLAAYREMFSAIFSDFHLFSRLYGLLNVDEQAVRDLLQQMQLADKTSFDHGRFTKRDLSTGQRKRLAMIVALLEDRPIFLFDEWAADQDPEFRAYFYEELIPALKRRGKTVIAVSHDDRYFDRADRVVVLDYGKIRTVDSHRPQPSPPVTDA